MMKTTMVMITLALGTGCGLEDEPLAAPELGELAQGLGSSNVTDRPLILTSNMLADWGEPKQISAALVTGHTLKVRYCAAHFPAGSTQLVNLLSALGTYNGAAGVAINLVDVAAQPGTTTHPNLDTFTAPADTIYLDYDDRYDPTSGVYAATGFDSCDSSSPRRCTQAHLRPAIAHQGGTSVRARRDRLRRRGGRRAGRTAELLTQDMVSSRCQPIRSDTGRERPPGSHVM